MQRGRTDAAVDPLARLASRLGELRCNAGPKPKSFRAIAQETRFSHSAVHRAVTGVELPSWALTKAYVAACNGDEAEIQELWAAAELALKRARQDAYAASSSDAMRSPATLIEFGARLRVLLDHTQISQRHLAQILDTSATTINAVITGRRLPTQDELEAILRSASVPDTETLRWHSWREELQLPASAVSAADRPVNGGLPHDPVRQPRTRPRRHWILGAALASLIAVVLAISGALMTGSRGNNPQTAQPAQSPGPSVGADATGLPDATAETPPPPTEPATPTSAPTDRPDPRHESSPRASDPPAAPTTAGVAAATTSRDSDATPLAAPTSNGASPAVPARSKVQIPAGQQVLIRCRQNDWYLTTDAIWIKSTDVRLSGRQPHIPSCQFPENWTPGSINRGHTPDASADPITSRGRENRPKQPKAACSAANSHRDGCGISGIDRRKRTE